MAVNKPFPLLMHTDTVVGIICDAVRCGALNV